MSSWAGSSLSSVPFIKWSDLDIGQQLGHGNFSVVFRGNYRGEKIAVKVVHEKRPPASTSGQKKKPLPSPFWRAKQELSVLALASAASERVTKLIGRSVRPDDGAPAIILRLYPGGSLSDLIAKHDGLPRPLFIKYACQIALALAELHAVHLVVRDLKPENTLLDEHNDLVLADFGLAQLEGERTRHGVLGTRVYLPPEGFRSRSPVFVSLDIWSFGCTLITMFSNVKPWDGVSREAFHAAVREHGPTLPDHMPPVVAALAERCFELEPDQRPTATVCYNTLRRVSGSADSDDSTYSLSYESWSDKARG